MCSSGLVGGLLGGITGGLLGGAPEQPARPVQAPENQSAKAPGKAANASANGVNPQGGGGGSGYSTLLTGVGGAMPGQQSLGKTTLGGANTLLGG